MKKGVWMDATGKEETGKASKTHERRLAATKRAKSDDDNLPPHRPQQPARQGEREREKFGIGSEIKKG